MSSVYLAYSARSKRLIAAGQQLLDSLTDPDIDRSIAIQDVEAAAATEAPIARFEAATPDEKAAQRLRSDEVLSSVLLDLQSANVLMSAGIALDEHGGGATATELGGALLDVESSGGLVTRTLAARAQRAFEASPGTMSATLEDARAGFRRDADRALDDIVRQTVSAISAAIEQVKRLDGAKVLEALEGLGKSFTVVGGAGRLIRQGIDKLRHALAALTKFLGGQLSERATGKVRDIWTKVQAGEYSRQVVATLAGESAIAARIASAVTRPEVTISAYDAASRDVMALTAKYSSMMDLLRSIISATVVAAGILAMLPVATPSLPLASAAIFLTVIGAAVLLAMDYTGAGGLVDTVSGVGEIADRLGAPAPLSQQT